ncbi:hypothetical protein [Clostridium sp. UBA1056]|uniref:hypothetical protein n=1 Tax=unclassified Clostridium TaxID=2614128 RepID=UPI00321691D0
MKNKILLSVIALSLILTGCSSDNINENKMSKTELKNFPSHISEQLDEDLIIDAETKVLDAENYNVFNVKYKQYDEEQICNIFIKDDIIDTRDEYGTGNDKTIGITTKNNKWLSIGENYLSFHVRDISYSHLMYESDKHLFNEMKRKFPKDTLTSLNKEESIDKVRQVAKELNLPLNNEPIVYSLDVTSLKEAENNYMTDEEYAEWEELKPGTGKRNWTEEDEAYLIIFKSSLNNIPIYSRDLILSSDNSHLRESVVKAVVNKNGIVKFEAFSMYDSVSLDTENLSCIEYSKALEVVKDKYKNIILTSPIKVTNINLEYIPRIKNRELGEFILTPAWVFLTESQHTINDGNSNSKKVKTETGAIIVDAITGKEMK